MDALRRDDLRRSAEDSLEEKARQTFDLAETGFILKRAALKLQYPHETEEQREERFLAWLADG